MEILRFLVVVIGATLLFPEYARPFDITQSEYEDTNNHLLALQDVIIEPTSYRVDAYSDFNITFRLAPSYQVITLKLQPSLDIIAPDAYIRHLDKDGRSVHGGPIERSAHKVFKGIVLVEAKEGKLNVGWARIYMIRHGAKPLFEGTFTVYHDQYHVQLASTYSGFTRGLDRPGSRHRGPRQDDYIIAYRITDGDYTETKRSQDESICRVNTSPASTYADTETSELNDSLFARQWGNPQYNDFRDHIGGTAGCPTSHRTALIGIVTDCTYTASFTSADAAHQNIVNVVNSASEIFERSFNISLQIQNITISDPECPRTAPDNAPWNLPCAASDLQQRLNLFSSWRGSINDDLAYWTLMTSCPTGGEKQGLVSWLELAQNGKFLRTNLAISLELFMIVSQVHVPGRVKDNVARFPPPHVMQVGDI
ncbi:hypothetical protein DTO217A2_4919 [Paecilomyces variotii]|nr:hypothetical protein DTO217A2_4919 [Paecilomyces variotii]